MGYPVAHSHFTILKHHLHDYSCFEDNGGRLGFCWHPVYARVNKHTRSIKKLAACTADIKEKIKVIFI